MLEAMAANCPVLATDCFPCARALLDEAEGCAIIERPDAGLLAGLIGHRLRQPRPTTLRAVAERYSIEAGVASHVDRLAELVGPAVTPARDAGPVRQTARGAVTGRRPATIGRRAAPLMARAAAALLLIGSGWMANDLYAGGGQFADRESIVEEALESDAATMVRVGMRSQIETPMLDAREIATATAIHLPSFPPSWRITDVQIYPSDAGPGVQIAIRTERGEPLTLLALHAGPLVRIGVEAPRLERHGAQSVAYWKDGEIAVALVSRGSLVELGALAAELRPGARK